MNAYDVFELRSPTKGTFQRKQEIKHKNNQ